MYMYTVWVCVWCNNYCGYIDCMLVHIHVHCVYVLVCVVLSEGVVHPAVCTVGLV